MLDDLAESRPARRGIFSSFAAIVLRRVARKLEKRDTQGALVVELPNGDAICFGRPMDGDAARLVVRNPRGFRKSLRGGTVGFAEAYIDRDVECSDLFGLFSFFLRNRALLEETFGSLFAVRLSDRLMHFVRRNSLAGSRRNISDHYDLGNEFFRAWLDSDMHYSSGIYQDEGDTLEAAQARKLDHIVGLLGLEGGEKILEIGCGWGAFARRAASGGAHVTGITLSQEQLALSRERAAAASLDGQCEFRLQDYRKTEGEFDRIVSIEMIEAVGEAYWPQYFTVLHDRLAAGGNAVIQAITIDESLFDNYRQSPDFIQRYVFPGGMLPTRSEIARQAEMAGLVLDHVETFGQSYAATLKEWAKRFEAAWPEITKMGFDERFRRRWRFYLEYCEAGFADGAIDVGLYRMVKPA